LNADAKPETTSPASGSAVLRFDDNSLLPLLYGDYDRNLARIEQAVGVTLSSRGNRVVIAGGEPAVAIAREVLNGLYRRLQQGMTVDAAEVDAAVRLAGDRAAERAGGIDPADGEALAIRTPRRHITPRSSGQARYMRALAESAMVFGVGPAGTGKTYLAVATAVALLISGRVDRIILSRPAVEAGERLGFLPGDLREKIDPYLAPLAFMRGRTLSRAFVILDEAQNATRVQMKMFLTRLGEGSRMAVTGDPTQVDLPSGAISGLTDAMRTLERIDEMRFVRFTDADVVRHSLVTRIVQAYEEDDRRAAARSRE
jgi:phosphate starvation-inducible PhoH-like protein